MLVLHAGIVAGKLLIWGERRPDKAGRVIRKRGANSAPPSPFSAGSKSLTEAVSTALRGTGDVVPEPLASGQIVTAWLPSTSEGPIASSLLIAPSPDPSLPVTLAPWRLTALPLSIAQSVALLSACAGRDLLAPGVLVGSTLLYWSRALRFAGALAARQQFLPDIEEIGGKYRARWLPLCVGQDAAALAKPAESMPSACRCLTQDAEQPPNTPAMSALTQFLAEITDHLVRSSIEGLGPTFRGRSNRKRAGGFDSIHEQWIYALKSPDGEMPGDPKQLVEFTSQVRAWRRPLTIATAAPYQLCLRLEEPLLESEDADGSDATWFVRYLIRPIHDPSLLIDLMEVWKPKRGAAPAGTRYHAADMREFALAALGQAARVCPEVEESLKSAAPAGYEVDTAGAQLFLTERAWLLEQSVIVVLLPSWWSRKGGKNRIAARANVKSPKMQAAAGLSMESIVSLDWQVVLGNETLTRKEIEALAEQKTSLVRLRGRWVQLDAREIEAALSFWKRNEGRQATVRDVVRMAIGAETTPGGLEVVEVQASGWIGELLARMKDRDAIKPVPVPTQICATLRPYQERGLSWLSFLSDWGMGACLADDMGLGKTLQTIAYIRRNWAGPDSGPSLVVCPTSVVGNWLREIQRFAPDLPVMVHHGSDRAKEEAFATEAGRFGVVLTSYALLHRDVEFLKSVRWSGIVLDEAQNIKNPETRQSKAARSLSADWRIALTGTPVENHVGDLWPIMDFLNAGLLGTQAEFRRAFFNPIQTNSDPAAGERLKRITQPFILRRLKTDKSVISDLPDKLEMKVYCTLTAEQASLYRAVAKEAEATLEAAEGMQRRGLILSVLTKLKQTCNHPAQLLGDNSAIPGRSGKLNRLTEMLEEVCEAGEKALIFTQYSEMAEMLQTHLQETFGREALLLHGGIPKAHRDRMIDRFQQEGAALPFFILSIKAGGTGLNLTAANHVFHFDRWWNPAVENQATDRAFRIGQKKQVQVHKFICAGTLEEKIDAMIESKAQTAERVVGSGEGWLTELSTSELQEIITLRRDALVGAG